MPAARASEVKDTSAALTFSYSYPAAAAGIPALARYLDGERAQLRRSATRSAEEDQRDAAGSDRPFHRHEASVAWQVVTETPRFLSLSAEMYAFTGGAHGLPNSAALLWDKAAGERLETTAVFRSPAALQQAIGSAFCRGIDAERARRRGGQGTGGTLFNDCPKVDEATVILGSNDRRAVNRIGLLVGPYVAGPYAEGNYEVTLPVTRAVLDAVKPAYRDPFAAAT